MGVRAVAFVIGERPLFRGGGIVSGPGGEHGGSVFPAVAVVCGVFEGGEGINTLTSAVQAAPYGGAAFHDNHAWIEKA